MDHRRGRSGIRAAENVGFDGFSGEGFRVDDRLEVLDLGHAGQHFDAPEFAQEFLGDGAGGHTANRFAGGSASATGPGTMTVFDVVGVIGMGRAELLGHFVVGLGSEVLVLDPHRNGGAQCESFEGAGQNLNRVGFFAGRDDGRLTRATAVQVGLDVRFGQRQTGRAAIDDHPDAAAMRFAPGGDAEELSKRVAHDAGYFGGNGPVGGRSKEALSYVPASEAGPGGLENRCTDGGFSRGCSLSKGVKNI